MTLGSPQLARATGRASALGLLYGTVLLWTVWPRESSSPVWTAEWGTWVAPGLLLTAQVAAVAGLVALVLALRGEARALARVAPDAAAPEAMSRPGPVSIARALATPLATVVAPTAGIVLASRGVLGPAGLLCMCLGLPAAALARAGGIDPWETDRHMGTAADRDARVSRLRGASLVVTLVGACFFVVSGSLVAAASLPWVMLREVPHGPAAPVSGQLGPGTQPLSGSGAGGGGGTLAPVTKEAARADAQAGQAIHALFYAGSPKRPDPGERPPVRSHPGWWTGAAPTPLGIPPHEWAARLAGALAMTSVAGPDRELLTHLATHPANQEFDRLEGIDGADVTGGRLIDFQSPVAVFEIPVPRYVEIWSSVRGRLAGAIWLAHQGDTVEAARRVDTVRRLGTLLMHDGPASLDALMGQQIVREAGVALEALGPSWRIGASHAATGSPPREPKERSTRTPADMTLRREWITSHAAALTRTSAPLGVRLEAFAVVQTFRPCQSLAAVLWAPDPWNDAWSQSRQESLAARPSEAALSQVHAHGWLGTRAGVDGWGWLPRVLAVALSDRPAVTHCAPLAATLLSRG